MSSHGGHYCNYHPGIISLSQVTATYFKIRHPTSTGAQFSNELQRFEYIPWYHNSNLSYDSHQMPCPIGNMHQINGIPLIKSFTHLNIMQLTRPQLEMKFLLRHQNSQQYKNRAQHKLIILKFTHNQNILDTYNKIIFGCLNYKSNTVYPRYFSRFFYWATVSITYFACETCGLFGDY